VDSTSSRLSPGIIAGAIWTLLFSWLFFASDLQNSPAMSRWEFWTQIPSLLGDLILGVEPINGLPTGWSYFAPRESLILAAGFIACGAWCLGRLCLRSLKLTQVGTTLERQGLALASGYAALSLLTLGFGLAGLLIVNLFRGLLCGIIIGELALTWLARDRKTAKEKPSKTEPWILPYELMLPVIVIGSFLVCMLLGALLPSIDFDVKEYHLQGPKEWFLAGEITWLKHNVYTSFPFLTEMLSLTGMLICGDWFLGALVGKVVLMTFAPLTALAIYCLAARWFSSRVGWWAALIYLTTPWVYRVSIIAYTEGALMAYTAVTLLAFELSRSHLSNAATAKRLWMVTGILAGSAMACKYPGLISVVLPISAAALVVCIRHKNAESAPLPIAKYAGFFILGGALAIGPWLLKNAVQTGNPVYPLAWSVFGGDDWNAELQAKWKDAHSPPHHNLANIPQDAWRILAGSDYQSLLLFAFAPLSWLWKERRKQIVWLWVYVVWLFASWWCFTHRIDRFWLPLIPIVSVLAAAGLDQLWQSRAKWLSVAVVTLAVVFNFGLIVSTRLGLNLYLADIEALANSPIVQPPGIMAMNKSWQAGEKLLSVGEANVFDARFPLEYNTVFDLSLLEAWSTDSEGEWLTADEIQANLKNAGITHVLVNWGEILRYRLTYRYTDFAVPESLDRLVEMGILSPPDPLTFKALEEMSENERRETTTTLSGRVKNIQGTAGLITNEMYRVLPE